MAGHPYYPEDLQLPGYVPLFLPQSQIVGVYGIASVLVVTLIWFISGRCSKISSIDRILMCWWAFTGLTHLVLEQYFVFSPNFYKLESPFYLAEVWKEYNKGDSRYAARDSAVVIVEGITAVIEGPACLLAVYAVAARKPYNYTLQLAICLGQLYGDIVYFVTAFLEGDNFSAGRYYCWLYPSMGVVDSEPHVSTQFYTFNRELRHLMMQCLVQSLYAKTEAAINAQKVTAQKLLRNSVTMK